MEKKWTPHLAEKVRSGTGSTASGTSCVFVQLTEKTGIKLYATKLERDASYVALSVAAEHGLAPDVGECVEITGATLQRARWWPANFQPARLYGFLTEVVDTNIDPPWDELCNLRSMVNDLFGFSNMPDICSGNIGRNDKGKLVAIDLDGRFSGLLSREEIIGISNAWGGGYW